MRCLPGGLAHPMPGGASLRFDPNIWLFLSAGVVGCGSCAVRCNSLGTASTAEHITYSDYQLC